MRRTIATGAALAATALALPGAAAAHVTLQPNEAPAGGFTRLDVRVPNERDDAGTTKVDVQLPPGFVFVSYEPVPGWDVKVTKRKLAEPIESHGEQITEEVGRITWTGDGKTGIIRPGQFQDFGLSLGMPDQPGAGLTFKALQTYENGEVVRWIEAPDAEQPAPQVELTAAEDEHGAAAGEPAPPEQAAAVPEATDGDAGAPEWLAIAALVVGALGLVAGGAALTSGRRRERVG
jgi:periplasmic copper chaperone A